MQGFKQLLIMIFILVFCCMGIVFADEEAKRITWFSNKTSDFEILKGKSLGFYGENFDSFISPAHLMPFYFSENTRTVDDTIFLECDMVFYGETMKNYVFFVELDTGEKGFLVSYHIYPIAPFLYFTISGDAANGELISSDNDDRKTLFFRNDPVTGGKLAANGYCLQSDLDAQFNAGKQYCIDNPEACGIHTGTKPDQPFIGILPASPQSYLALTDKSVPFFMPPGSYVRVYSSTGSNTVNVRKYARMQLNHALGNNTVNIEEPASDFMVKRSGSTVYLQSAAGTLVKIPATTTTQTIRFADGSSDLIINGEDVTLGGQIITLSEATVQTPAIAIGSGDVFR